MCENWHGHNGPCKIIPTPKRSFAVICGNFVIDNNRKLWTVVVFESLYLMMLDFTSSINTNPQANFQFHATYIGKLYVVLSKVRQKS